MISFNSINLCYNLRRQTLLLNKLSGDAPVHLSETGEFAIINYEQEEMSFMLHGSRSTLAKFGREIGFDTKHRDFIKKVASKFDLFGAAEDLAGLDEIFIFESIMPIKVKTEKLPTGKSIMMLRFDDQPKLDIGRLPFCLEEAFLTKLLRTINKQIINLRKPGFEVFCDQSTGC